MAAALENEQVANALSVLGSCFSPVVADKTVLKMVHETEISCGIRRETDYHRSWDGIAFEGLSRMLDGYIGCCNAQRRKKSLGWKSPEEHRLFLGYAV